MSVTTLRWMRLGCADTAKEDQFLLPKPCLSLQQLLEKSFIWQTLQRGFTTSLLLENPGRVTLCFWVGPIYFPSENETSYQPCHFTLGHTDTATSRSQNHLPSWPFHPYSPSLTAHQPAAPASAAHPAPRPIAEGELAAPPSACGQGDVALLPLLTGK